MKRKNGEVNRKITYAVSFWVCLLVVCCKPQAYVARLKDYKVNAKKYNAKSQDERIRMVVMHYTVGDTKSSISTLTQGPVSAHYLITDRFGEPIYQLVRADKRAWHAGVSYWRGRTNINDVSIGIEIVNPGYKMICDSMIFKPFEPYQILKVAELVQDIVERYPDIDPTNIVAHADIAPGRKQDPGAKFPWKELHDKYHIGAWYDEDTKEKYAARWCADSLNDREFIEKVQADFSRYGYSVDPTGEWDAQTRKVIFSFQLHFRPALYDGKLDVETYAILEALLDKYRRI